MHRVISFVVLLSLLVHSIPLSSLALELPVTEEPAAEPDLPQDELPEEPPILFEETPTTPEEPTPEPLIEEVLPTPSEAVQEPVLQIEAVVPAEAAVMLTGSYEPEISGTVIAKSPDWAWDPANWHPSQYYATNIDFFWPFTNDWEPFQQDGIITHVVMPIWFASGDYDRRFHFSFTDAFGQAYDCATPEKSATEWGFPVNEIEGERLFTTTVIGPFTGSQCDSALRHAWIRGGVMRLYIPPGKTQGIRMPGAQSGDSFWQPYIAYTAEPESEMCEGCASNVLFIPGIKGSRLYIDEGEEEKVWDPLGNDDIRALFLNENGQSLNRVYTKDGDVLGSVAGFIDFYEGFLQSLGSLVNDGAINNWEAVAYDWRLSLEDIVTTGSEEGGRIYYGEATTTPYIEQTLRSLAASSKTGKVTIVAHSNGGLVTKALLNRLGDAETSALVDKIVFVGVPQSGAPQALGALLFGYKEGLPWWFPFMVSPGVAREMAENSPMGYHLLPTQDYFDSIAVDPAHQVARFNAQSLYTAERAAYGEAINNTQELFAYLVADEGGRTKPDPAEYTQPQVLNANLLAYANNVHTSLNTWRPPADVALYQIAGWGEDTVSGIEFYDECISSGCKPKYRPMFIEDGDGVVPIPSALMIEKAENVERYWVDLNIVTGDHGNILDKDLVNEFIGDLINNIFELPAQISNIEPTGSGERKLIFILHSPLTLEVEDQDGNRSGLNEDGSESENIPGSQYGRLGETQYIIVPAGGNYEVQMQGTGTGIFSLDIQEVEGGEIIKTSTVANLPASPETFAHFSISHGVEDASPVYINTGENEITLSFIPNSIAEQTQDPEEDRSASEYYAKPEQKSYTPQDLIEFLNKLPLPTQIKPSIQENIPTYILPLGTSMETATENETTKEPILKDSNSWLNTVKNEIYNIIDSFISFLIEALQRLLKLL